MKVEQAVQVGVHRSQVGQEGLHRVQGEDGRMAQEVLVVAAHHNLLVEVDMRLVGEGMHRAAGSLEQREVPEDNHRIGQEEDHRGEGSGLAVEAGNILLEGHLEEDVRTLAEGRENVLGADNPPEALRSVNINIWPRTGIREGLHAYEVEVYCMTCLMCGEM